MLLSFLGIIGAAVASPWPVWGGQSIYMGANAHTFLSIDNGGGEVTLPTRAGSGGGLLSYTAALPKISWGDVNITLPAISSWVGDDQTSLCTDREADDFCRTSTNLGVVSGRVRLHVLQKGVSPVDVSLLVGGRTGAQHAASRHRLTAPSEGTTDVGAGLSVGRVLYPSLGELRLYTDGVYWLRGPGPTAIGPADEISAEAAAEISIRQSSVGVVSTGFWRQGGDDLAALSLDDPNVWSRLDAAEVKVGLKGSLRLNPGASLHASVLRTVYAENNPNDTLAVGVGVNLWRPDPQAAW